MSRDSELICRVWDACHDPPYDRSMDAEPLVNVVRGTPTAEEVAALVVALASRSTPTDSRSARPSMTAWAHSARPSAGHGNWRGSGLPA
jgi:acyl-CoA carboxylase epsilon subunit-like protein